MNSMRVDQITIQRCTACSAIFPERDPRVRCHCGGLLEVRHLSPTLRGEALIRQFDSRRASPLDADQSGVWRYRELILPSIGSDVITQPEGNTPLLAREVVSRWCGAANLRLKHEGHNPTGSFKDRGMTVGVTQARRIGARAVACASTGNTSASLAAYAALAGLPALVFVPAGQVALGKLAQTLAYGAHTLLVRGDFDTCLRLVSEASERLGAYLLNSINPYRIEGQKSIVLEILDQLAWQPPDWIVLPAGNLGNTAAFGKALEEAREAGLIDRLPRIAAVQAAGAAPFAAAYPGGFTSRITVKAETIATAIKIGDPASWDRAVKTIRLTDGVVTAVSDDEILEAKAVVDASGVGCEPASAASVAGTRQLVERSIIKPGERVVALLTGHLLKDPEILLRYHRDTEPPPFRANRPVEIDATLDAVARVVETFSS